MTRDKRSPALVFLALVVGAGCTDGPAERFEDEAVEVFERRCATTVCHGVAEGEIWPGEGFFVQLDGDGRLADLNAARANARQRISTHAPRASSLIRVPLPSWAGGGPHAGGVVFSGPDDSAVTALLEWIDVESEAGEDVELTALQRQFGDTVLPVLVERCARGGCHGPRDIAFTAFPLHPGSNGEISDVDVRASHRVARRHLDLWSDDARRSRLLRKSIGEHDPAGLVHRGGRDRLFPEAQADPFEAPGLQAMLVWAQAERAALGVMDGHSPEGVIYIDGPAAPRTPYRIESGLVGSDLFLAGWPEPGEPRNLTASLHPEGPAEIRDTAVSHDASRVLFAMRRETETEFAVYEQVLATGVTERISPTGAGSFVQPTYASDDRKIAVWDGHGELGADGPGIAPELVILREGGLFERLTFTPAPEVYPAMLASGKTRGELVFGTRRTGARGIEGMLFRFPMCHDGSLHGEPEYHVQYGASLSPRAPLVTRDLPDGRQVMIVLENASVLDDRGALLIMDRALGPDLGEFEAESSLGGYRRPVSEVDGEYRYRDPAPLPDGTVLVSRDEGAGEDALYVVRITDTPTGAQLAERIPWLSRLGRSLRSAVAVFTRPPEDDGHESIIDEDSSEGILALRDVAILEAIFGRTEPRGVRPLLPIQGIRLLAASGARANEVRYYDDGGTTVGLSHRIPATILGELSLPTDRSAYLAVPVRTPLLLQLLDGEGMEVGNGLDRWYYAEGAEVVPGGTNQPTYDHTCSGCHGAASGDPFDTAAPVPDAISAASVTLSTYEERNRRRPIPPLSVGADQRSVDFVQTIRPIVEQTCLRCHGEESTLPLVGEGVRFSNDYEVLVSSIDLTTLRARRSPLMARLSGRALEVQPPSGTCVPGGFEAPLLRAFTRWIEAGAFYDLSAREPR